MELVLGLVSYLVLVIAVLVRVAFVTLMEQKVLGETQIRLGPNYTGYRGILQPFADAVKLFSKERVGLVEVNLRVYYLAPVARLWLVITL